MLDYRTSKVEIVTQGGPVVSEGEAIVYREGPGLVLLHLDLVSKYSETAGTCGNQVFLHKGSRGLYMTKGKEEDDTLVSFPEFDEDEWHIEMTEASRYTLRVLFVQRVLD